MRTPFAFLPLCCWGLPLITSLFACFAHPASPVASTTLSQTSSSPTTGWSDEAIVSSNKHLTLAYTTDTNGYLQSCGCTAVQVGGLARRATVLEGLRKTATTQGNGWLLLDGGNLADSPARSEAVLDSMRIMGYGAVAFGWQEERLGDSFLRLASDYQAPMLRLPTSNEPPRATDSIRRFRIFHIGDYKIALIALPPDGWKKHKAPLIRTLANAAGQANLLTVIGNLSDTEAREFVESPDFKNKLNIFIGVQQLDKPIKNTKSNVLLLPAAGKGQICLADLNLTSKEPSIHSYRATFVDDHVPENTEVAGTVALYFSHEAETLRKASQVQGAAWRQIKYEAPQRCASCHQAAYAKWQTSKHALAARTLELKQRLVPQCLSCHSELYRRTEKFDAKTEAAWHGVACTTCHGDGVLHTAVRTRTTITRNLGEAFCRKCHDPANDPEFNYASYRERIRHW